LQHALLAIFEARVLSDNKSNRQEESLIICVNIMLDEKEDYKKT